MPLITNVTELSALRCKSHLLKLLVDDLWLLVSLEPHHVLRMKPPALLLERLCGQILRLRSLHVVEHEEKRFRCETLKEINCIRMWKLSLQ